MPDADAPDIHHLARLARLALSEEQVHTYRAQLAAVMEHVARVRSVDVAGVEPLAHPADVTNRLADDEITEPMPLEQLLALAPAVEGDYIAVPKVLEGGAA